MMHTVKQFEAGHKRLSAAPELVMAAAGFSTGVQPHAHHSLRIGPYDLANPWILAPMAGVSEKPFRSLALSLGAGAAPTELISAKGLLHGQARSRQYLQHEASEHPFWVQIFGGDPESMAEGAQIAVAHGAHIIDINMGCPVRKVTKNGAGSALLSDPKRAAAIVSAIVSRTQVPVTVKIRAGWDADSLHFEQMAHALADAGAQALAMHARTRAQGYSGKADWTWIAQLVAASPIPVIGNGDAFTPADARRMKQQTGCAAVMIGRGALGNPWVFEQLNDPEARPPNPAERWRLVAKHLEAHLNFVGDSLRGIKRFRPHLMWYARGIVGASAFRAEINTIEDETALRQRCADFFGAAEQQQASSRAPEQIEFEVGNALG